MLTNESNVEEPVTNIKLAERLPAIHAYTRTSECGTVVSSISFFTATVSEAAEKYGKPTARYNTKLLKEDDDVQALHRLIDIKNTTTDEMERTRKYKEIFRTRRRIQILELTASSEFAIAQKRPYCDSALLRSGKWQKNTR